MNAKNAAGLESRVNLSGRVAIVTGAAQGIGAVYARYLAASGCHTVVSDVNREAGEKVAADLVKDGMSAEYVQINVGDEKEVTTAVDYIASKQGKIDILVNNAALFSALTKKPFEEISHEEWRKVMLVNVDGTFLMSKAVSPHMRRNKYGRIINISSTTFPMGRTSYLHYVTSKAAVVGITRSTARELGEHGITVNAIMPTLIETGVPTEVVNAATFDFILEKQSIKRTGQPEDLARVLLFLASVESGFITGQTIAVDGGGIHL